MLLERLHSDLEQFIYKTAICMSNLRLFFNKHMLVHLQVSASSKARVVGEEVKKQVSYGEGCLSANSRLLCCSLHVAGFGFCGQTVRPVICLLINTIIDSNMSWIPKVMFQ